MIRKATLEDIPMIQSMAANGPTRMEQNVNRHNPAVAFYEHMGMHKNREGDFDIGHGYYMNDYIMAMDLD